MAITKEQRDSLADRILLLALLDPDGAQEHRSAAEAIRLGLEDYLLDYHWRYAAVDPALFAKADAILRMLDVLERSVDSVGERLGLEPSPFPLRDLDAGDGSPHFWWAPDTAFSSIEEATSEPSSLEGLRRMMEVFEPLDEDAKPDAATLTREGLRRMLDAA